MPFFRGPDVLRAHLTSNTDTRPGACRKRPDSIAQVPEDTDVKAIKNLLRSPQILEDNSFDSLFCSVFTPDGVANDSKLEDDSHPSTSSSGRRTPSLLHGHHARKRSSSVGSRLERLRVFAEKSGSCPSSPLASPRELNRRRSMDLVDQRLGRCVDFCCLDECSRIWHTNSVLRVSGTPPHACADEARRRAVRAVSVLVIKNVEDSC